MKISPINLYRYNTNFKGGKIVFDDDNSRKEIDAKEIYYAYNDISKNQVTLADEYGNSIATCPKLPLNYMYMAINMLNQLPGSDNIYDIDEGTLNNKKVKFNTHKNYVEILPDSNNTSVTISANSIEIKHPKTKKNKND